MSTLIYRTVDELTALFRSGEASPVDVTRACLDRIAALDGVLGAFVFVDEAGALAAAKESEARWKAGAPLSPIDGIPTSIKDIVLMKGWPTLRGSALYGKGAPDTEDAPAVARLREAGAVLLGKTATCDHGWKPTTDNPVTGQLTRNPWNPGRTPGGSSGGAGAALASGMCVLALGSDGGGSIRIPASFCGVFGLKPTFGRVSSWPMGPFATLGHVGPMTRTVKDAAHFLNIIAKPDIRDANALPPYEGDYTDGLSAGIEGLRIAYSPVLRHARVERDVAGLVEAAAHRFEDLGASVEPVDPFEEDPLDTMLTIIWANAAGAFDALPEEALAALDPGLKQVVEEGRKIPFPAYFAAMQARDDFSSRMNGFFARYDLLLTPTVAVPPIEARRLAPEGWPGADTPKGQFTWAPFGFPFNLSQQPAASVPCGFTSEGLPVGLQIVAAKYREDLILRAAAAYEAAHPVYKRKPNDAALKAP